MEGRGSIISNQQRELPPEQGLLERIVNADEASNFLCQVCQDILQDPRECSKCRNVFCFKCMDKWQANQRSFEQVCPLRCKGVDMMKISIPFKNQLECLKLYCKNKYSGCEEVLTLGSVLKHEKQCQFELIQCHHDTCGLLLTRQELDVHLPECQYMPKECEFCKRLVAQGFMKDHIDHKCDELLLNCKMCGEETTRKKMLQHLDFDCCENEIKCRNYPSCRQRFKKKNLENHLSNECLFEYAKCAKCTLNFIRPEVANHDCVEALIKGFNENESKNERKRQKLKDFKEENTRMKEQIRERDKRIFELENQVQSDQLGNLVGLGANNLQQEEVKEQFYRRDPTFQKEDSQSVYQGGQIEAVHYLSNGHIAISGTCQNNKLVICDLKNQMEIVQEISDHTGTITAIVEIDSKLITCGIDKNIVVYDIKQKQSQSIPKKKPIANKDESQVAKKGISYYFSCFAGKKQKNEEILLQYEYTRNNTILNAHNSQINCIIGIKGKFFATGATKEVKIWKFYECLQTIPNAHGNSVLCLKTFRIMSSLDNRQTEIVLVSGSKDKYLKFWNLSDLLQDQEDHNLQADDSSQSHGSRSQIISTQRVRPLNELSISHFNQVNTCEQINDSLFITGTSDGKIQIWKHRQLSQNQMDQQQQQQNANNSGQNSRMQLLHSAQVFTVSTLHIQLLTGYNYNEYPYVAMAGMVSKVIIYDVKNMTVIQSLRVLISNWQTYIGVVGLPEEKLAVGCLDGTLKIYKTTFD